MEPTWRSECGRAELWLGDCLQILPTMEAGSIDCVVTDPPYGIGVETMTLGNGAVSIYRGQQKWDVAPTADTFNMLLSISTFQVVWGGNYFSSILPSSRCWLVWDKRTGKNSFADCELAWTNLDAVVKMITIPWVGANAKDTVVRYHPTQKPVKLMLWCLGFLPTATAILDPYMGVGSVGVACIRTGRHFIGVEIDPAYFAVAKRRIMAELAQGVLPLGEPESELRTVQPRLFDERPDE